MKHLQKTISQLVFIYLTNKIREKNNTPPITFFFSIGQSCSSSLSRHDHINTSEFFHFEVLFILVHRRTGSHLFAEHISSKHLRTCTRLIFFRRWKWNRFSRNRLITCKLNALINEQFSVARFLALLWKWKRRILS